MSVSVLSMKSALTIRLAAVAAILICLAVTAPTRVGACVCGGADSSPCVEASAADAVFVAEAIQASSIDHGWKVSPSLRYETRYRMRVTERFHGSVGAEVDVLTDVTGSCAFGFEYAVPYVVYAYRRADGQLTTGLCSPTHRVASDKGDLAYLRAAAQAPVPTHGTIEGKAVIARLDVPLKGIRVVARAGNRRYETTTARDGSYALAIPPGSYRVRYVLGAELYSPEKRVRVVRAGSCVAPEIFVLPDGRLTGRVVDSSGTPVSNVAVSLTQLTPREGWTWTTHQAITDANGAYSFVRVFPGRFRLALGLARLEPGDGMQVYHPGVIGPARATTIRLALAERKALPDLIVPAGVGLLTVSGTVRRTSGLPFSGATVLLMETQPDYSPHPDRQVTPAVSTDGAGRFAIAALAGRYEVWAGIPSDEGSGATHMELKQSTGKISVTLTLPD